jgi:small subunit ribosomal protein S3
MGHKVHPIGFRLGVIGDWHSKWYAARRRYTEFLQEDLRIRKEIETRNPEASISQVEIERGAVEVVVTAHTSRPGIVIGRGGQRVDELRRSLEELTGKRIRLNIQEIREPELDATLVSRNVAAQIEHHVAYRRAMKRTMARTMQVGAKGIKIICSGRLGGAEIARRETMHEGRVPLHTLRADIDYGLTEARTEMGRIGIKVWIYKGDILPQLQELEMEPPPSAIAPRVEGDEEHAIKQTNEVKKGNVTTEAS